MPGQCFQVERPGVVYSLGLCAGLPTLSQTPRSVLGPPPDFKFGAGRKRKQMPESQLKLRLGRIEMNTTLEVTRLKKIRKKLANKVTNLQEKLDNRDALLQVQERNQKLSEELIESKRIEIASLKMELLRAKGLLSAR